MNQSFKYIYIYIYIYFFFFTATVSKMELQILYPLRNIHHCCRKGLSWNWESNPHFQDPYLGQLFKVVRVFTVFQNLISYFMLQVKGIVFTMGWQVYRWCTCGVSLFHLFLNIYINLLADAKNYFLVNCFKRSFLQNSLKGKGGKKKKSLQKLA